MLLRKLWWSSHARKIRIAHVRNMEEHKYNNVQMDLQERGCLDVIWTNLNWLRLCKSTWFFNQFHELGSLLLSSQRSNTHISCSIVWVPQTNAFSSSPAVTNRWPSGEKRHVRTPEPLTWKLGRPRLPLCKDVWMSLNTKNSILGDIIVPT